MIECADFSHWQTSVDFVALKAAGVAAVFLKATQGEGWIDQTFTQRCVEAHAAGLLYGAYHFCDDSPPAMQTAHFLAVAAGCTPVLALDVPSGIDATTGTVFDPAIRATATMTLALPKEGLDGPAMESHVGELYLADISVPPRLYARPPLNIHIDPLFACEEVIRLR